MIIYFVFEAFSASCLHKTTHKVILLLNLHLHIIPFHHYLTDIMKCHQQKKVCLQ